MAIIDLEQEDGTYQLTHWKNCIVPDCENLVCFGLSTDLCFPHLFKVKNIKEYKRKHDTKQCDENCGYCVLNRIGAQV